MLAANNDVAPAGCVLLAVADEARRSELRAALERRRINVESAPSFGDTLRGGRAEHCDVLLVSLGGGVRLRDAMRLRTRLRVRNGRAVPSVALVPGEDGPQVARMIAAGFDLVFGRLARPEEVAEAVVRLRARRDDEDDLPPPPPV